MSNNTFTLKIITPDHTCFEGLVKEIYFTTSGGKIGILANHTPIIGNIFPSYAKIATNDNKIKIAIINMGLFKFDENNKLTITTDFFEFVENINKDAIASRNEFIEKVIEEMMLDNKVADAIRNFTNKIAKLLINGEKKNKK